MERKKGNVVHQYKGMGQLLKRCLTFMLATVITVSSIPLNMVWADELPYFEQPGDDDIILDDSVEEGDLSDIDLDISHSISKKGDKAVITVSAVPSESGLENGVTKVNKVEIHENGKLKKGKRSNSKWEFTVKENGVYSFVIYYISDDGEAFMTATPSEIEKVEPTTEAEPQNPGANTGGAGGGGTTWPEEKPDTIPPETEVGTTDNPTGAEDDKKNDSTAGDSDQNTSVKPEQKPSDLPDSDKTEDGKGDVSDDEGGTGSSDQDENSGDSVTDGSNTDNENSGDSGLSDSGNNNSDSSDNSGSGSNSSNSSDNGESGSGDSGSSDDSGSDGDESSDTSVALNIIDFFFPVIEVLAGDFTVKKAVIVEYEITNLFPNGSPEDVDVDIFDEPTKEGAMITLLVEPSEIGLEKGVREITDVTLVEFEAEDDSEIVETEEIGTATGSEIDNEIIEEEEDAAEASPSEATYDTVKSSSAKHVEYQSAESEEGEYRFYVKENGTYTFSIRYGRTDVGFENSTELLESQFNITYELDSLLDSKITFVGVDDIQIVQGTEFDLLKGVSAIDESGEEIVQVAILDDGGFDSKKPGEYTVTYVVPVAESGIMLMSEEGQAFGSGLQSATRKISVKAMENTNLELISVNGLFQAASGELPGYVGRETLTVNYKPSLNVTDRYLELNYPSRIGLVTIPSVDSTITQVVREDHAVRFYISDKVEEKISFDIVVQYFLDESSAYDTWTYSDNTVTTGAPITIQENYNGNERGSFAELPEMDFPRPVGADLVMTVPTGTQLDNMNHIVVKRNGESKSGGMRTVDNYIVLRNTTVACTALDYVKIYWKSDTYKTASIVYREGNNEYEAVESKEYGTDERGDYTKYYISDLSSRKPILGVRVLPSIKSVGNPYYYQSESTILKESDIEIGYTTRNQAKTISYEYRPTVTVERWKELDYDIKFTGRDDHEANGIDSREKYIHIGRSDYNDGVKLQTQRVSMPSTEIVDEIAEDSTYTYYRVTPYTSEAILSIELPYELDLDLKAAYGKLPYSGTKKLTVAFTDGSTQTFSIAENNDKNPLNEIAKPEGEKVKKIELHYDGIIRDYLYGGAYLPDFGFIASIPYICGTEHEDGTPIVEGEFLKPVVLKADIKETESGKKFSNFYQEMELIARDLDIPKTETNTYIGILNKYENSLIYTTNKGKKEEWLNGQIYKMYIKGEKKDTNLESEDWVNPILSIISADVKSASFLTGEMTCNSFLNGWSINYSTEQHGMQQMIIPDTTEEWQQIRLLSTGDRFDSEIITFSKEGTVTPIDGELIKDILVEVRKANEDDRIFYGEIEEGSLGGGVMGLVYTTRLENKGIPLPETNRVYLSLYTHCLAAISPTSRNYKTQNAYQGSVITEEIYLGSDRAYYGSGETKFNFGERHLLYPKYMTSYVKINDTNTFHYVKGSLKSGDNSIIEDVYLGGEEWFKITMPWKNGGTVSADFFVDPAAAIGSVSTADSPQIEVYADYGEYLDSNGLSKSQVETILKNTVQCPWEPEKGEVFSHATLTLGSSNILLNSVAGAQLSLGAGTGYSRPTISFQNHEKDKLEALLSFGNKDSKIYNIEILLNIPKKGDEVKYREASETKSVSSEYNIFLTGNITPSSVSSRNEVSYEFEENGVWKAKPDSWNDVTRVKVKLSEMEANESMTFKIPIRADSKEADGTLSSYMATAYKFSNIPGEENTSDYIYGGLNTYNYIDYTIGGIIWEDVNENGGIDTSSENKIAGVKVQLYREGETLPIAETTSKTDGTYQVETRYFENLKLKVVPPDNMLLTRYMADGIYNGQNSKFVRDQNNAAYMYAELQQTLSGNVTGMNAGFIKLPTIVMDNVRVKYGQTIKAKAVATSAAPDKLKVYYAQTDDTTIANLMATDDGAIVKDIDGNVTIQGNKLSEITTATVWAENSLGDKVSTTYQIAVSDNKAPVFTDSHPWVAIEGDTIPDFWAGIEVEDPEEEYPMWRIALFGMAGMRSRSIGNQGKHVTIYKNSNFTDETDLSTALGSKGIYYVRYSVEDDMNNIVTSDTTLTVYGKMQGDNVEKHYFATGEAITVPVADFYYLDPVGAIIPATDHIQYRDVSDWVLNEGVLTQSSQTATHPMESNVTSGVVAGSGRFAEAVTKGAVDSRVTIVNTRPIYEARLNENVEVGWTTEDDVTYNHWTIDGNKTIQKAERGIKAVDGTVKPDNFNQDTSVPVLVSYEKYGLAPEYYDNQDSQGNRIDNTITVKEIIRVIDKPVVEAETVVYVTPDQAKSEVAVKGKLNVSASYHDGENDNAAVPEENITINFIKTGDVITSAVIQAWAGREDNLSDVYSVVVAVREKPVLTISDIHLRKGDSFTPDERHDKVLTPSDEHNTYEMVTSNVDTSNIGRYEVRYKTNDDLTGAEDEATETVYVHDMPVINAVNKSLYTHESTGESALIEAVRAEALAKVNYVDLDGTSREVVIPADDLHYEVEPGYESGKEGRFKITITADDTDYAPNGLTPVLVEKEVYVNVTNQVFDVTFSTNNDGQHDRGTIDGGNISLKRSVIYGETTVVPVPEANAGYHFDGFKTLNQMNATQDITLKDGTAIKAGDEIPIGTLLSLEQVQGLKIYDNVGFQTYFSATPVLKGQNIKLYVGDHYETADLEIDVSDLDGDAQGIIINDDYVDTSKTGTYQVKVSVEDGDQNHAEMYVYIQVYGKTELEGYDPIHTRKGQNLSEDQIKGTIKATYEAPPEIPDSPWNDEFQPAAKTEIPYIMEGEVNTQNIGLTKLTIRADGQISGREADGRTSEVRNVFVHGNPIITADDGALYTHQSTASSVLIDLIKQGAQASVQYVEVDGSIRTEQIPANKLNYEINPEENYQTYKEGTYKVTISANDGDYVPNGLQPVDTELQAAVIVSDKAYTVKFSINNEENYHKGDYEGGGSAFSTNAIHGNPVGRVPVPVEADGYHFDGFKTITEFTTTDDIQLADGSTIASGTAIPVGTILTLDQVKEIKIYKDVEFQAYFTASPVIAGENIILYEGEEYKQEKLHIEVTDIDQNAQPPVIDDMHVNTNAAGTYQVKVTVTDTDGNLTEKYLYVQVVGKTKFIDIPDLHTRKNSSLTAEQLVENIRAAYDKPMEIPEEPWSETDKVNNGRPAVATAVEVRTFDVIDTDTVQKTKINVTASGMIHGREMIGKADSERNIYIHGLPVIVAYDNGIYTHQSTDDTVLKQIVQTGAGSLVRDPASAYVEYVQVDGSIKMVDIDPSKITYEVNQYVPLTAGDYMVNAKVDDFSVLAQSQVPSLSYAVGEKTAKVVVADKMYTVLFEMGEHGGLEDPAEAITAVAHGKKVAAPKLAPEEGYTLDYWVDETGNRVSNISDVVVTENRKFTAEFKLKEFTVRFIGKKERVIKTEIVKYGHDATPPTAEEDRDVKNSKFTGWSKSYYNIKADTDIYATYHSSHGGGGGHSAPGYVSSGPGANNTINEPGVPKNTFENLVTIGTNTVPTGNMDIPTFTGLPKTGDLSTDVKASIGYQATLIDGTRILSDDEPLVGHQNGSLIHVFEGEADWKKCILHIILLIISVLEAIFYLFKRKKDKRLLEKLRKELEEEDE